MLPGFLPSLGKYGKNVCHPVWKSLENIFFGFFNVEKEYNFPDLIF